MTELNLSRQSKLVPPSELGKWNFEIFGIGSVGSHLTYLLSKTGFRNLRVYDLDTVDEENIGPQCFDFDHIGMNKVDAIADKVKKGAGIDIQTCHGRVEESTQLPMEPDTIYICVFDSFSARKLVYDKVKNMPGIFIDARIGRFEMSHFLVDLSNTIQKEQYEKTFPTSGEGSDLLCGEKASAFINYELVGRMVANIVAYISGKSYIKRFMGNSLNHCYDIQIYEQIEEKKVIETPPVPEPVESGAVEFVLVNEAEETIQPARTSLA
jgi:molybdopterin/thiamine biosynthesis adenylyltransferase